MGAIYLKVLIKQPDNRDLDTSNTVTLAYIKKLSAAKRLLAKITRINTSNFYSADSRKNKLKHYSPYSKNNMITKEQARRLKTLITKHVNAEKDLSWSGEAHPNDRPAIEHNAVVAKTNLRAFIRKLSADQPGITLVSK